MSNDLLLWILVALIALAIVLQVVLLLRKPSLVPLEQLRDRLESQFRDEQRTGRAELSEQLSRFGSQQTQTIETLRTSLQEQTERAQEQARETADRIRTETKHDAEQLRTQVLTQQNQLQTTLSTTLQDLTAKNESSLTQVRTDLQNSQQNLHQTLTTLRDSNSQTLKDVQTGLQQSLESLQKDNADKLERMRETVDEKLSATLKERLDSSFSLVSERLEKVHHGLGEMQELANGVGDLKRVLGNVKDRGTFGETQLGALLEQVLTREQYEINVETIAGSGNRVEFAIKMPGQGTTGDGMVLMPIDAKFPREDYERLLLAQEAADVAGIQSSAVALERRLRDEAKKIAQKYVEPPRTTDFAILFLPTEGLYAEALRRPGLFDDLQRSYRITIAGPTTLLAILNALQMGFRSLAIEKRSSEMWEQLGAAKTEFGKFAGMIEKANDHIANAQKTLSQVGTRSRAVERKLRGVENIDATGTLLDFKDDPDFRDETA